LWQEITLKQSAAVAMLTHCVAWQPNKTMTRLHQHKRQPKQYHDDYQTNAFSFYQSNHVLIKNKINWVIIITIIADFFVLH
jgi:hypothetical protein